MYTHKLWSCGFVKCVNIKVCLFVQRGAEEKNRKYVIRREEEISTGASWMLLCKFPLGVLFVSSESWERDHTFDMFSFVISEVSFFGHWHCVNSSSRRICESSDAGLLLKMAGSPTEPKGSPDQGVASFDRLLVWLFLSKLIRANIFTFWLCLMFGFWFFREWENLWSVACT